MHLNSAIVIYSTKKEAKASLFGNPLGVFRDTDGILELLSSFENNLLKNNTSYHFY